MFQRQTVSWLIVQVMALMVKICLIKKWEGKRGELYKIYLSYNRVLFKSAF
jgi:hypothetical protein